MPQQPKSHSKKRKKVAGNKNPVLASKPGEGSEGLLQGPSHTARRLPAWGVSTRSDYNKPPSDCETGAGLESTLSVARTCPGQSAQKRWCGGSRSPACLRLACRDFPCVPHRIHVFQGQALGEGKCGPATRCHLNKRWLLSKSCEHAARGWVARSEGDSHQLVTSSSPARNFLLSFLLSLLFFHENLG